MGAIQIHIKIGAVETLRTTDWSVIPDDRQTRIETIGGKVVQDFGIYDFGDTYSCTATLKASDAEIVSGYWHDRELVEVRDVSGRVLENMRVVIKKYGYVNHFEQDYYWADFEFWQEEDINQDEDEEDGETP